MERNLTKSLLAASHAPLAFSLFNAANWNRVEDCWVFSDTSSSHTNLKDPKGDESGSHECVLRLMIQEKVQATTKVIQLLQEMA